MNVSGLLFYSLVGAFLALHLFFFAPLHVFLANQAEFRIPASQVAVFLLVVSALALFPVLLFLRFLDRRKHHRTLGLIAGLALYLYLQFFWFVWDYGILDGRPIDWTHHRLAGLLEAGVLIVVLGLAFFLGRRFSSPAVLALAILLAGQAVFTLHQYAVSAAGASSWLEKRELRSIHELSADTNVIIFVIDTLQGDAFHEIVQEDRQLRADLAGFTFFRDAVGAFPFTHLSVQAILTGSSLQPGESMSDYRNRVLDQYVTQIISNRGGLVSYVDPSNNLEYLAGLGRARVHEMARLFDVAIFRQAPHFLKRYVLNDYAFRLRGLISGPAMRRRVQRDLELLEGVSTGSFVGDSRLTFKFFHLWGAHLPALVGSDCRTLQKPVYTREGYKDQARCVLTRVSRYLGMLRDKGVYDQSLIFLLSDHGSSFPRFSDGESDSGSIPEFVLTSAHVTIAVKDFSSRGEFQISEAPAALSDVATTILKRLELPPAAEGRNLFSISASEPRTRSFYYFKSANEALEERIRQIYQFDVEGPVGDVTSWTLKRHYYDAADSVLSAIDLGNPESAQFLGLGWSGIETGEVPHAWTRSRQAGMVMWLPDRESGRLTVSMRTFVEEQSVQLRFNGRHIATWEVPPDMQFREYQAELDLSTQERMAVNEILLVVSREGRASEEDMRKLGVSVNWVRFD